ncbi:CBS domain-containing protein [Falsiroseomonas selenitidurans]|uniref:CBS domain-containing protein n=1 Tax=Falsiroseomonas selenitidurans TaxID=2716335 RepID=A0ABX1E6Z4_9PROT|nr:CBS domain-containing protein [Falsiroseomonas selenitidurans]NKC30700.1 CBS domain-containing protein [Falsiroseomonas selenitidurans]
MTIAIILRRKGTEVISVATEDTVGQAAQVLSNHRIGAALVRDSGGEVLGIVSERDIVRVLGAHGAEAVTLPVAHLMTRALHTVTPRTRIAAALALMTDRRVRHLPVLEEDGSLAGMVSIGDLVKARIEEAVHEAEELRHYVESAG